MFAFVASLVMLSPQERIYPLDTTKGLVLRQPTSGRVSTAAEKPF